MELIMITSGKESTDQQNAALKIQRLGRDYIVRKNSPTKLSQEVIDRIDLVATLYEKQHQHKQLEPNIKGKVGDQAFDIGLMITDLNYDEKTTPESTYKETAADSPDTVS